MSRKRFGKVRIIQKLSEAEFEPAGVARLLTRRFQFRTPRRINRLVNRVREFESSRRTLFEVPTEQWPPTSIDARIAVTTTE